MYSTIFSYQKIHEKVDFQNKFYNKVQDLCYELFPDNCIIPDEERDMISIIYPVSLSITFNRSEDKIYFKSFFDCNKIFIRSSESGHYEQTNFTSCQASFRVFDYDSAERYLRYKKGEGDLIKIIKG